MRTQKCQLSSLGVDDGPGPDLRALQVQIQIPHTTPGCRKLLKIIQIFPSLVSNVKFV